MNKILDKYLLGPKIVYLLVEAPLIAGKAEAGQFVILRLSEQGERIPLTIADYDRKEGTITLVCQEIGKTTHFLGRMQKGDYIPDVLGPQGNPTEVELFGKVVVVGGGIGVAPVYPLARELKEKGNEVISIVGFRSKEYVFWEEKMRSVSNRLLIATNDGSYGQKGMVTDLLKRVIDNKIPLNPPTLMVGDPPLSKGEEEGLGGGVERVFAIGPAIMMKAVVDLTREKGIKTIVSLNSVMVCGMGMCGACRVAADNETKFTCMDGADFDGHKVDFTLLMERLDTYKAEEKASFARWKEGL